MKAFSALLDALSFEAARNRKLTLIVDYLRATPDPDRGYALAALCGDLTFHAAKPALLRAMMAERVDPILFALSYDFVGDLSETMALLWPGGAHVAPPRLGEVVAALQTSGKDVAQTRLADWLDGLDETGRWALLKLITGALRVGVSAALARQAVAIHGGVAATEIEEIWHGLEPPYSELFAWLDGATTRPSPGAQLTFFSPMLAHPLDEADLATMTADDFFAEWKWDGIRVQAVARTDAGMGRRAKLFSRSGDDIGAAFPDLLDALDADAVIDGELVVRDGDTTGSFSALQQRLNRKTVSGKLMTRYPAHLIAYDLLFARDEAGDWRDLRALPFMQRRARLATLIASHGSGRISLSPEVTFDSWAALGAHRAESHADPAIEGVMLKRRDSVYIAGRPTGPWWKWKRDPHRLDCVLMYAQRGHGKRSSLYSDYTFGLWRGDELVPVGQAYFGFTDEELGKLDRFVRHNTTQRFGPVREVLHTREAGLVLEIAFEGAQLSTRHKSGYAMRFPRVFRIRWDKPPGEADRLEALAALAR